MAQKSDEVRKYVNNLDGISIPNDQNGKSGIYVGRITVDMKKKK